ncbi:MAG: hypothetical protein NAG76_18490 [Candidatus Pristimantibacillus lignocellulolyticus]|uniref:SAM-dependent methyltransferase n=1 Tax=Candidatus Pristimantibacillus lignocellulolyticus TaxID=2994561 RepID=A0A9J6ZCP6_9BACL|nr:MAG: hypothetical protein NAG76_18490 [Candidatus Pristimantibacillus lignocellulolyticus]
MENKETFNYIANEYEKYRPTYPEAMFDDIMIYSNIMINDRILEIGCGTGQATAGFVHKNYKNILA